VTGDSKDASPASYQVHAICWPKPTRILCVPRHGVGVQSTNVVGKVVTDGRPKNWPTEAVLSRIWAPVPQVEALAGRHHGVR
jgi:hypothetical protein